MGVEYNTDLMYGIVLKEEDLIVIAGEIRPTYVDWQDWDERYEVMNVALSRVGEGIEKLLGFEVISPYPSNTVQIAVYAKSSYVNNDSKRGDGKLFEKGILGESDLKILEQEREVLVKFKELYDLGEEIQMLAVGRVH